MLSPLAVENREKWPALRRALSYYAATFFLTHALGGAYILCGGSWSGPDSFLVANLLMLVPGLTAAAAARWLFREPVRAALALRFVVNRWLLVAWLLPVALSAAVLIVGLALPGAAYSPDLAGLAARFHLDAAQLEQLVPRLGSLPPVYTLLVQGLLLGPTLCALTGLGEEAGWRGLLVHQLSAWGFWRRSWLIGFLWGLWHVPLVFEGYGYSQHPFIGAALLITFTLLASPLYVFLRARAGTVLAPAICHGSFSACMLLTFAPMSGGSELISGLMALPGLIVMAAVNVALVIARRRATPQQRHAPRTA